MAFWALIAFAFVLLLAPQNYIPALAPLRIALLAAAVSIAAHILNRLKAKRPIIELEPAIVTLFYFLCWTILTIPFSQWPGGSVAFLMELYLKTVIVFILLTQVLDTPDRLMRLTSALVLMAIPMAGTTVSNFMAGAYAVDGNRVAGYLAGLTENPNDMALMLNLLLPLAIALAIDADKRLPKLIYFAVSVLIVLGVISTFSRGGFLTLITIGLCYGWSMKKYLSQFLLPVIVIFGIGGASLLPDDYINRISTITSIESDETGSAQVRLHDMKSAMKHAITHPLIGSGVGMNELTMNDIRGETWTEIHNVYLQILLELGAPGLILYLMLLKRAFGATRCATTEGQPHPLAPLKRGLRISLIAFCVAALFHPVAYHFYFYIIAGIAFAAGRISTTAAFGADNV